MKYNWSIIGHEKQLKRIESDIASGGVAHAYLLTGPNSVGKFTVAKKMAGILQCKSNFCHKCNVCKQIQKGGHIDTVEMRDNRESIKIEDARNIIERSHMTGQSNYKVFLIQSVERMTIEAANSFLKILEEPPKRTLFILTTNNVRALLPTVVSRARIIHFGNVSARYLREKLAEMYPDCDKDLINKVSLFSLGKTGKAINLIENPDSLAKALEVYHLIQNFLDHKSVVDRFSYIEDLLGEDAKAMEIFFGMLTHVLRSRVLEGDARTEKYLGALEAVDEAGVLLKKNVNSRLVLENLMLTL